MTSTVENKELIRSIEDAVNNRDSGAIADIYAEDFVFHRELDDLHGLDEFTDYLQALYDAFPDMTITIEEVIAEDDRAAVRYTGTGTHEHAYKGVEPTGEEVRISGMRMVRIEDGKIVEAWGQTSNLSLLAQLGVVEPPAQ
jgi:steroid delta-isomerase-like uncharacterized protein